MSPIISAYPRVIFLDIDGVLQPTQSENRFSHDMVALRVELVRDLDPGLEALNRLNIAAEKYDWYPPAVENLKRICRAADARIVISSTWREDKTLDQVRLFFKLHDIDTLVVDMTDMFALRDLEIQEYLVDHPEIEQCVIVDDRYVTLLNGRFLGHFVRTFTYLDDESVELVTAALQLRDSPDRTRSIVDRMDRIFRDEPVECESFTLEETSLFRRARQLKAHAFIDQLCAAIENNRHLTSLTLSDIFQERRLNLDPMDFPLSRIRAARDAWSYAGHPGRAS